MSTIPRVQEYQLLTEEQKYKVLRAVNRTKKHAIDTGRVQFVVITFEPDPNAMPGVCKMTYSESHQMPRVLG